MLTVLLAFPKSLKIEIAPSNLTLFDCSECPEIGFLGFRQPLDMRDVHALIWSFPYQCLEAVVGLQIPEFDCSIVTAAGKGIPVGAESHPPYPVGVTLKRLKAMPGIDIPEADHLIIATAGKHISIRAEGHRSNPAAMHL